MTNYIPFRSILGRIPKPLFKESTESDFLSWALDALRRLPPIARTESKVQIFEIKNNKVSLPKEIKSINLVTYMVTEPDEECCNSLACCVENPEPEETWYNTDSICRYTINYKLFLDSLYYNTCYSPLKFVGNSAYVVSNSPNRNCNCQETYTVDKNKCLHTSYCDGFICVDYNVELKDDDGNFLIPDYQNVISFLTKYATMKHWEERASGKEEGAFTLYQKYQQEAESQYKAARGEILLKNADVDALSEVVKGGFNKLIKVPERYIYAR